MSKTLNATSHLGICCIAILLHVIDLQRTCRRLPARLPHPNQMLRYPLPQIRRPSFADNASIHNFLFYFLNILEQKLMQILKFRFHILMVYRSSYHCFSAHKLTNHPVGCIFWHSSAVSPPSLYISTAFQFLAITLPFSKSLNCRLPSPAASKTPAELAPSLSSTKLIHRHSLKTAHVKDPLKPACTVEGAGCIISFKNNIQSKRNFIKEPF